MWELLDIEPRILATGAVCGLGVILMIQGPRNGGTPQIIGGAFVVLLGFLIPTVWQ